MANAAIAHVAPGLSAQDLAALRLCCRSWKECIDSSLTTLAPYLVGDSSRFSRLAVIRHLDYRARAGAQRNSILHSPLSSANNGMLRLAQLFRGLQSLTLQCRTKGCGDLAHLGKLPHLTACALLEFPFSSRPAIQGVAECTQLARLRLHSVEVCVGRGVGGRGMHSSRCIITRAAPALPAMRSLAAR